MTSDDSLPLFSMALKANSLESEKVIDVNSEPESLSVSDLNKKIKTLLETRFNSIWVRGEISGFKAHSSGHFYFQLKDANSIIKAVMFKGSNSRLKFKPHDGLEVLVRAKVGVYEPRGDYQLTIDMMEPVGAGALQKAFEQLKDKLAKEGLFESALKRALPGFPKKIAIVTSPTGAAIQDILNILGRRTQGIDIIVVPTVVQGAAAAPQIRKALQLAYQIPDLDVIILGRGGGSIEDMWCFNDEELARLVRKSPVPLISAVGHEIDFTICDFVADLRAPTPSAAAELVVKNSAEVREALKQKQRLLIMAWSKKFKEISAKLDLREKRLVDPRRRLADLLIRADELVTRLETAKINYFKKLFTKVENLRLRIPSPQKLIARRTDALKALSKNLIFLEDRRRLKARTALIGLTSLLDSVSPLRTLERGYAVASQGKSEIVKSAKKLKTGDELHVHFADGWLSANILKTYTTESKEGDSQWILKKS